MNLLIQSNTKTSMLVYNSSEVRRKYRTWTKTFPWIKPHYAIKSNPSLPLLMDLIEQGSHFDCASRSEIQTLLNLGVKATEIVYSNPIKEQEDLQWASEHQIPLTTADTIDQLLKIKQYAPQIKILWRIAIKEEQSDHLSTPFSNKFGDDLQTEGKIHQRMKEIQQMNINLSGIHFHCGSGQHGSSGFERAILKAKKCMEIGRIYGHQMSIMDIGGGFPAGQLSQKTIEVLKMTEHDPLGYKIIAEPGRHFCSNSSYLLTKVLGKRQKNNKPCFHLNESLYHSFNCNIMDSVSFQNSSDQFYSSISSNTQSPLPITSTTLSTLFGMTCDGMDVITQSIHCPTEMKVGDWLIVGGMGAYTYGCRTQFNGMKSCGKIIRWSARIDNSLEENGHCAEAQYLL